MKMIICVLFLFLSCSSSVENLKDDSVKELNVFNDIKRAKSDRKWVIPYKEDVSFYKLNSNSFLAKKSKQERKERLIQIRDSILIWLTHVVHERNIVNYEFKLFVSDVYKKLVEESTLSFHDFKDLDLTKSSIREKEYVIARELESLIREYLLLRDLQETEGFESTFFKKSIVKRNDLEDDYKVQFTVNDLIDLISYPYTEFVKGLNGKRLKTSRARIDLASDIFVKKIIELKKVNKKDVSNVVERSLTFMKDRGLISKFEVSVFKEFLTACKKVVQIEIHKRVKIENSIRQKMKYSSYFDLTGVEIVHVLSRSKLSKESQEILYERLMEEMVSNRRISKNKFLTVITKFSVDVENFEKTIVKDVKNMFVNYLFRKKVISVAIESRKLDYGVNLANLFFEEEDHSIYLKNIVAFEEQSFEDKLIGNVFKSIDRIYAKVGRVVKSEQLYFRYLNTDFKKVNVTYLAKNGTPEAIERAKKLGYEIDSPDDYGFTPLMLAIQNKRVGNAMKLIRLGANIRRENIYGDDAIRLAKKNNLSDLTKYLERLLIKIRESENR